MQIIKFIYNGETLVKFQRNWCKIFTEKDIVPLTPWYDEEVEQAYNKFVLREKKLKRLCK